MPERAAADSAVDLRVAVAVQCRRGIGREHADHDVRAVNRLALVREHVLEDALAGLDVLRRPLLEVVEVQVQAAAPEVLGSEPSSVV